MGHENVPKMNWDNIKTISQFDGQDINTIEVGSPDSHITSNNDRNHNNNNNNGLQPPSINFRNSITDLAESHPTASTSLLIESLIQLLCLILEDDPNIAQKSYKSICEQLNRINLIDNSYSMNEFEEIRSQYQMQIYKIICAVRGQDIPISLPSNLNSNNDSSNNNSLNKSQSVETCWSRYHREFEEISFIAGGGFGKVFKARHKLDCIEYAVKQIKIHSTTIKLCHLAEVKTIASLNHPNIVQYKAAWLEPYLPNRYNNNINNSNNLRNLKIYNDYDDEIEAILSSDTNDNNDYDKIRQLSKISTNNNAIKSIENTKSIKNKNKKTCNDDDIENFKIEFSDSDIIKNHKNYNISQNEESESSDFIQFEHSNKDHDNDDDDNDDSNDDEDYNDSKLESIESNKRNKSISNTDNYNSSNNYNDKLICKYSNTRNNMTTENYRHKPKLAILYIQMSLCQLTLRKWLNERNSYKTFDEYYIQFFNNNNNTNKTNNSNHNDNEEKHELIISNHFDIVNDIFSQILSGLNYIHSRNIVHHDIKPSNIFLGIENDGKLIVQLGDFGLACPLQNAHHGIALGTPLYAAPEQLNGECNPKSDIYSLGIVLLELLLKFNTDMERIRTIENARKGILPNELSKQSMKLLKSLLNNEKLRPNTKELIEAIRAINLEKNLHTLNTKKIDVKLKDVKINELKEEIKNSHLKNIQNENEISNLLLELNKKNQKIDELMNLLKNKDDEIIKLKHTINRLTTRKKGIL